MLMKGEATWEEIEAYARKRVAAGNCGRNGAYGLSKACVAAYTQHLGREQPRFTSSCCSPGFIDTPMTKGYGATKPASEGTLAIKKLLFEELGGSGWYYGSDGVRSPYHFMRNPGEPEYDGVMPF